MIKGCSPKLQKYGMNLGQISQCVPEPLKNLEPKLIITRMYSFYTDHIDVYHFLLSSVFGTFKKGFELNELHVTKLYFYIIADKTINPPCGKHEHSDMFRGEDMNSLLP